MEREPLDCALFSCYNKQNQGTDRGRKTVKKKKTKKLYHKLFWTYTAIACVIVGILVVYFMTVLVKNTISSNMEDMRRLGQDVSGYIQDQEKKAEYLHTQLYRGSQELDDMIAFFTMEPDAYRRYVLDYFSESNSLNYRGTENFINEAFEAYPNLKKVELLSYSTQKMSLFYPQEIAYPYRDGSQRVWEIAQNEIQKDPGELVFQEEILNPYTRKQEGCILFTFSARQQFQEMADNRKYAELLVLRNGGQVVYSSLYDLHKLSQIANLGEKQDVFQEEVGDYEVYAQMDFRQVSSMLLPKMLAILTVGMVVLAVGILCISVYIRRLTMRVDTILEGMNAVKTGNLSVHLDLHSSSGDELDTIADHFNDMCRRLEEYIQKSYTAEIEKKNAQMQALQSQINPHFLYNTLEAIRMRAICNNDREVGKMLYSMSVLFRSQLKENDWITVGQELDYCKQYLELFECRFQGNFQYEIHCPVEFLETKVIKFMLQPVIENYFIHGIRRQDTDNLIQILVQEESGYLLFSVIDNGIGMESEVLAEKNRMLQENEVSDTSRASIGLSNVQRRVRAVYGPACGVQLRKNGEHGLEIIVKVRMEKEKHEEGNGSRR